MKRLLVLFAVTAAVLTGCSRDKEEIPPSISGLEIVCRDVRVLPDSVTSFEVRTVPEGTTLNIGTDSMCAGLRLVFVDSPVVKGEEGSEPDGYEIVRVRECEPGLYSVCLRGESGLVLREDVDMLTLDTVDVFGNDIQVKSGTFVCSSANYATLDSVEITCGGVRYKPLGFCNSRYNFCLPSDADLTKITAHFQTNGRKVTVNGVPQTSGESVNDFSRSVTYVVTSVAGLEKEYVVSAYDFDLPVVYIETPECQPIVSKENWIENTVALIVDDGKIDTVAMSIKGRGNSSWKHPKKPYSIKLNEKKKLFGMPKHKRWCLIANWRDRTLMRNAVAFEIARKCGGLKWTPHGEFVETILNGKHLGCYYLCEQIKVDKNRVNIAELDKTMTGEAEITGGYIMEVDNTMDETFKFTSDRRQLPWMFKDPDDVNSAQFAYMENYVREMENALYNEKSFLARKFADYIDFASFIDFWFVSELTYNDEPPRPRSVYMYKDRGGKMCAGPAWDYDRQTFKPKDGPLNTKAVYYGRLFQDRIFVDSVKVRWADTKGRLEEVFPFIDEMEAKLTKTDVRNHEMWPINMSSAGDEHLPFKDAVARLKSAFRQRSNWLDGYVNSL